MSFSATMRLDDDVATIRLTGDLDARSAPEFNELVNEATGLQVNRMVLIMDELAYMSSAGLRCLVFAHQKMPPGRDLVLVGARPEVVETIKLTGFDRSVLIEQSTEA
ncbi:anti-sigma factor antagonist [Allonocardiopsis opalescens]|uniref:Anti-sigma factor antagonist n=1 Tax=Allonocardiopsis opalescens TaxID=1144618 RepID=A0A2T0PZY3_9ACTN|nr:anti-sigma factor antagonist [Allonocardiopsis opalescens]PRX97097.1 anti-anti-sigma factor [Allonocardiopsis opalescens]